MAYVTRLRLDQSATLILHSGLTISDIAYKVGYDVPSSFNKAFKKRFGVAPTDYADKYEEITANLLYLKTERKMDTKDLKLKIKEISPLKVIYVNSIGAYENKGTEEAWNKVCSFAEQNKLFGRHTAFIGISHDDPKVTEAEKLRYDACVVVSKEVEPQGEVGVKNIEGGKYAIFLHKGPYENFKYSYEYIFGTWLPESGEELRDAPCLEKYLNSPDDTKPEKLKTEIMVPLK
jgi:AraC family transcriptional regulator